VARAQIRSSILKADILNLWNKTIKSHLPAFFQFLVLVSPGSRRMMQPFAVLS
jgi:hypothetical protein